MFKDADNMTVEDAWKLLNARGIYTMEEFNEAKKKAVINIGIFTAPLKRKEKNDDRDCL